MCSRVKVFFFFWCFFGAVTASNLLNAVEVKIAYPRENAKVGPVKSSFVFGSVSPATAALIVNGSTVPVYRTGSFLAYIPFTPGDFAITAEAVLGDEKAVEVRKVYVQPPEAALPASPLKIASESLEPFLPMIVRAGDKIRVKFRGSPGAKAEFRFKDAKSGAAKSDWKLMAERSYPVEGSYDGLASVPLDANGSFIEARLTNAKGSTATVLTAQPLRVVSGTFQLAETKSDETILRTGPTSGGDMMGYDFFLPKGTLMEVTGRAGTEYRVKVAENIEGWTEEKNLDLKEHRVLPRAMIDSVKIKEKEKSTLISIETKRGIPYRAIVSEDLKTLTLVLYQATSNIDRVRHDNENLKRGLKHFRWLQKSADTLEMELPMRRKIRGYDVRYDSGKLLCEIYDMPEIKNPRSPLKGLTIAVDPGHSPDPADGAISPQGIKESEVNYQTALILQNELERAGSKVFVTKLSSEAITLPERGRRAHENMADLLVSVHANALPDGADPFQRRGFSVFYYQPQSAEMARAVHESFKKKLPIPDDGFYYANLAVCRVTQMPAILTESGYLIRPDEEELLLDRAYQTKVALAIVEGLTKFLQSVAK